MTRSAGSANPNDSPSEERLLDLGLSFQGRPLEVSLTPWMPTHLQVSWLKGSVPNIFRAAVLATERFVADPSFRRRFGYGPEQEAHILAEPGYECPIPIGRLDCFLTEEGVKFLEFNTDGTAGWHYQSCLVRESRRRLGLRPSRENLPQQLHGALVQCFRQWDRQGVRKPRIAIVDWAEVGTRSEQEALAEAFRAAGNECTLEDPRRMRLREGRLEGSLGPVDLVYRRVVSEELFARAGEVADFLEGHLAGAACFVGSFRSDPAWSKILFAVLWDDDFQASLPADVLESVRRTVPITLQVEDRRVVFKGQEYTLRDLLSGERPYFVLKPAKGYGGRDVGVGAILSGAEWAEKVERAFREGSWVAQEFVEPPHYPLPGSEGCGFLHVGAFVLNGEWSGLMARLTEHPVLSPTGREIWLPAEAGEEG